MKKVNYLSKNTYAWTFATKNENADSDENGED